MYRDPRFFQHFSPFLNRSGKPATLGQKIIAVLLAAVAFALTLMFSIVVFAAVLTIGLLSWGYLWWKTRALRKQMRSGAPQGDGTVIDGEVIRIIEIEHERDSSSRD